MPVYYRRDDQVQNGLGQAVPNVAVTYYLQPGMALASVYSSAGGAAASNPQITNGLGQTVAYMAPGFYTVTYSGAQIQTLTLADQGVGGGAYDVVPVTPAGLVNGVNRAYTLPTTPLNPAAAQYYVNRALQIYGVDYTVSGANLTNTTPLPLQTGDLHEIFYS